MTTNTSANVDVALQAVRAYVARMATKMEDTAEDAAFRQELASINSWGQLTDMWLDADEGSRRGLLLEERQRALIAGVTLEDMPPWFLGLMRSTAEVPDHLESAVNARARAIAEGAHS